MTEPHSIDLAHARASWDAAADVYTAGQTSGRDRYRYAFFGPAQLALCGPVGGLRALDVGCGNGYFARELATRGAHVRGIDLSPRMIEHARRIESASPLGIDYRVGPAESLASSYEDASFDLVASCMALQDTADPAAVLRSIAAVLRPGGRAVVSITHPCTDTPFREWLRHADGRKRALSIDRYFERTSLDYRWTGWGTEFTTPSVHAPLADWFAWMLDAGFTIAGYHEPRPTDDAVRAHPDLEDAARVPYFAMFELAR